MGDSIFYRVRTRVPEAPGSLATLAKTCGEAGVNILGLQIYPDLGSVTDDLVIRVPEGWSQAQVVALVRSAGGTEIAVRPCEPQELQDQPTRWLAAVRTLLEDPTRLDEELAALVGDRSSLSATEEVRVAALKGIVETFDQSATPPPSLDAVISYRESEYEVRAVVGRGTVGAGSWQRLDDATARGYLEVAPAWQRMGVGRQLLRKLCGLAAGAGFTELLLVAPASEDGLVPLLAATGMRGRIKLTAEGLQVRISLSEVRPLRVPLEA
ncbi:MAG: GNAT family N-acetyltransferase [Marmoricola sp.]